MVKASDVCQYLEEIAPLHLAEPWDNVGMLLGRSGQDVRCVMTCLTLTESVASEAIHGGVQMIVTHHPVLFRSAKRITDATAEGRILLNLAEAGIVVYSPHTAFDSAAGGVNEWLATQLGLNEIRPLRISPQDDSVGAGRFGTFPLPVTQRELLNRIRDVVAADYMEFAWNGQDEVGKVAIACGSAGDFLDDAVHAGCHAFVTGEARFHTVLDSQARGISLILTGHFCSERPAVVWLAKRLQQKFPEMKVVASRADRNPLELYVGAANPT